MSWPNVPWADIEAREGGGWRIRVPVRKHAVTLEKRTVVYEEVEVRREMIEPPSSEFLPKS
ncbi:MAG TPA: hypothetical protein VK009_03150 [Chloroflexota bacterium]|nr:hypothetical protein [Chloroflexota bacterium]